MSVEAEPWNLFGAGHITGPSDHLTALLARNWRVVLLRGVFCIVFGLAAFFLPTLTLASLVLLFAVYMLVDGVLAVIAAVGAARRNRPWGMLVLEGVADLVAGAFAFFWPLVTVIAVIYLMGAWGIVSGALLLSAAFRLSLAPGRWLMALAAVLSMVWGVLVLLWPITGALALTLWLGAYAVIFGVTLLFLAARLRRLSHELPAAATA
jgi:uncharacterized membrane protein HdeD (DUF308 family)